MTTAIEETTRARNSPIKIFMVSTIGTALEYYDFIIYGIAAALVASKVFFPGNDPMTGMLLSLGVFGVGFLARPLGGIISGHFGDRFGRRPILLVTLVTMGAATVLIGFLPPYASIGVWSPILLVSLRLLQGAAAGGEWGGATLFSVESAPAARRGFFGSFVSIGMTSGSLVGVLVFAVVAAVMPNESLVAWGWRIPFLLGGVLILIGVFFRAGIAETDDFKEGVATGKPAKFPLAAAIRKHPRETLKAMVVAIGYSSAVYITFTYILSLVVAQGYSSSVSLWAQAWYMGINLLFVAFFGHLSDRIGRRPVIAIGAGVNAVFMFAFVALIGSHDPGLLYLGFAGVGLLTASMLGPMPVTLAEQFHASVRASALSTTYQVGNAIGGAFAPLLAVLVFAWSGQQLWSIAVLSAIALLLVTVGVLLMKETSGIPAGDLG